MRSHIHNGANAIHRRRKVLQCRMKSEKISNCSWNEQHMRRIPYQNSDATGDKNWKGGAKHYALIKIIKQAIGSMERQH